jgi:hypothetical protein
MNSTTRTSLAVMMTLIPLMGLGAVQSVSSPSGKTVVEITDNGGRPAYSVIHGGKKFLLPSPLGLNTNIGDFTSGMAMSGASETEHIKGHYSLPNIKKREVDYDANRKTVRFSKDGKDIYEVIFHVDDNNVAFRYRLLPQGETRCCVVEEETTGFMMPDGTTTFLCPQSAPMTGFARTAPSYESSYTVDASMGGNGWGEGFTFPSLFKNNNDGWILISETGIAGDYCGSHLGWKEGSLYTIAYPHSGEQNGFGTTGASVALPGETPWRTLTIGETLAPIVETTIPFDVVEPLYTPSRSYEYGKGMWSWIMWMDGNTVPDVQREYIDFAHEMGYTSVLVDALWDTQIGYGEIERLAEYGRDKDVDLFLWYNSNGSWNDAPQGPRGIMNDIVKRRKEMAWMRDTGIRGIKVDFFGGDKQETMRLYHDILADANDYGLLVIFHGCTLPRGWERMYPNFVASEAVLASENLHFSQGSCDAEAFNATLHPVVRNAVGSMDFGGSALNKYYGKDNMHGSKRITSDVFALATAVMFQSAVQHFALAPNNMDDAPAWAMDFMRTVPTTWDETRFIEGYPGKYLIMARRHNDTWYICGVNADEKLVSAEVELPEEIRKSPLMLYSDDKVLKGGVKSVKPDKKGKVKVNIPRNGAFVIINGADPDFQVYICLGQSNMEGATPFETIDTENLSDRFLMMPTADMPSKGRERGKWYTACPPLSNEYAGLCPADYFGREMLKSLPSGKRIGVLNVAVGGCKIELFDPAEYSRYIAEQPDWMKAKVKAYGDKPYRRLVAMAREAQRSGVIKGILLHQGESNTGDKEWPVKVKALYERLLSDLGLNAGDVPLVAGEVLSEDAGGVCHSMNEIINTLPDVIPGSKVVSSEGCPGVEDGLHFTVEGYREMGRRYAESFIE